MSNQRIALWNEAKSRGMSDDAAYTFIEQEMKRPAMSNPVDDVLAEARARGPLLYPLDAGMVRDLVATVERLRTALEEARLIVANLPHDESLFLAKIDAALNPTGA